MVRPRWITSAALAMGVVAALILIVGLFVGPMLAESIRGGNAGTLHATRATLRTVQTALSAYRAEHGSYPPRLAMLAESGMLGKRIEDGWRKEFEYRTPGLNGREYSLTSRGRDGQAGTDDDVDVTSLDRAE